MIRLVRESRGSGLVGDFLRKPRPVLWPEAIFGENCLPMVPCAEYRECLLEKVAYH